MPAAHIFGPHRSRGPAQGPGTRSLRFDETSSNPSSTSHSQQRPLDSTRRHARRENRRLTARRSCPTGYRAESRNQTIAPRLRARDSTSRRMAYGAGRIPAVQAGASHRYGRQFAANARGSRRYVGARRNPGAMRRLPAVWRRDAQLASRAPSARPAPISHPKTSSRPRREEELGFAARSRGPKMGFPPGAESRCPLGDVLKCEGTD